jgi:aspartate aminotransferase
LRCTLPAGAFYAFPDISSFLRQGRGKDSLEFSRRLLQEAGVAVVPGSAFGLEGHIRISFATSLANLEKGLDRMETALANF